MVYLDHNASAPLRPDAKAAMDAALAAQANPSSIHAAGRRARATVEAAREQLAGLAAANPNDVIFTSGGSEANWLAMNGAIAGALEAEARITRLFVSAIEHDSVRANAAALAERVAGLRVETIPVTADGVIDVETLCAALREGKGRAFVAVMAANNETGVIQPIDRIAEAAREAGAVLHVDAVQAAGKIALGAISAQADYLALSAHKLGGPQGVGALIVKDGTSFLAQVLGGGQEKRRRAGTENVAGIAGFGAAAAAAREEDSTGLSHLRDSFERDLKAAIDDVVVFGADVPRLPNTSNFALPGIAAQTAVIALDLEGVMVSSGAACSSGKVARSHVLEAMGVDETLAAGALRVSFGWSSTENDRAAAIAALVKLASRARARAAA